MASEVDICNMALAHIGDSATVSSLSPPEGSSQAEHCARFYPQCRDLVLEQHEWGFATKRISLALLGDTPPPGFQFVYQAPNDCLNVIKLLNPYQPTPVDFYGAGRDRWGFGNYGHEEDPPYELETRSTDNSAVIYTNLENAMLQYVARVTDTTKFSTQFNDAVAWLLAAYLCGPVVKGDTGAAMAKSMMQAYQTSLVLAQQNDANNRRRSRAESERPAAWISSR